MCIVRWSYSSPVICEGLVKMENNKGYYYDGDDWVRDDAYAKRAFDNYRYDCDWMNIGDADGLTAEEELEAAKASIRRRKERVKKGTEITADDIRAETDRHGLGILKLIKEDDESKYYEPVRDIGMEDVCAYHHPSIVRVDKRSGYITFMHYDKVCEMLNIERKEHTGKMKRFWLAEYETAEDGSVISCSKYVRVESFDDGDDCFEYEADGWRYMVGNSMDSYKGLVFLGDDHTELFSARQRTLGLENDSADGIKSHTNIGPLSNDEVDVVTGRPKSPADYYEPRRFKLHEAIMFATEKHAGQKRKGSEIDYICHPLEVAQILTEIVDHFEQGYDELIIAGLLHDLAEDRGVSFEEIEEKFGPEVRRLVEAHTHPKDGEWLDRKMKAVEEVRKAPTEVKALVLADKLSNLRSIYADWKKEGEEVWSRFNAGMHSQRIYYNASMDALEDMQNYEATYDAYWEATELFKDIFVSYYVDDWNGIIWQGYEGNMSKFTRVNPSWEQTNEYPPGNAREVHRLEAEMLEDQWKEDASPRNL